MAEPESKISELMDRHVTSITTTTPIEEAVGIFDKYDRSALPIVTKAGVLVGIVTFDDIIDRIKEQTTEDIHKFGGTEGLEVSYTQSSLLELVQKSWMVSHLVFW